MPDPDLVKWKPQAAALGNVSNPLHVPYQTALKEAVIAACFQKDNWLPAEGRPGLVRVKAKLPEATAEELTSLVRGVQAAHTDYLLIVDPKVVQYGDDARSVVGKLEAVIEFTLDDGVEEEADVQLAQLKKFDADAGESSTALSQSLSNYAALAETLKPRLIEADSEFDVNLIAKARELSQLLLVTPGQPTNAGAAGEAKLLRDQMLVLMMNRVRAIRSAARYLYGDHPELVRQVTSAYERRRRAELRAKKAEEAKDD